MGFRDNINIGESYWILVLFLTGRKLRKAKHDDGDNLDEEEEELDFIHLPTIRANIRITLHAGSFLEALSVSPY